MIRENVVTDLKDICMVLFFFLDTEKYGPVTRMTRTIR